MSPCGAVSGQVFAVNDTDCDQDNKQKKSPKWNPCLLEDILCSQILARLHSNVRRVSLEGGVCLVESLCLRRLGLIVGAP